MSDLVGEAAVVEAELVHCQQERIEKLENDLYKAAECGSALLSTNQLLNDKLENREREYAEQLEVSFAHYS